MMLVPAPTPDTTPELVTVAMPVEAEVQGFVAAGVPDPVSGVVEPTHTFNTPEIVGKGFTLIVTVAGADTHPLAPVTVTV
jgi:hypothetical protein